MLSLIARNQFALDRPTIEPKAFVGTDIALHSIDDASVNHGQNVSWYDVITSILEWDPIFRPESVHSIVLQGTDKLSLV